MFRTPETPAGHLFEIAKTILNSKDAILTPLGPGQVIWTHFREAEPRLTIQAKVWISPFVKRCLVKEATFCVEDPDYASEITLTKKSDKDPGIDNDFAKDILASFCRRNPLPANRG